MDIVEIYCLNVDHGDTTVIHLPGDRWGVVDAGGKIPRALRFFQDRPEIKTLDFIVWSHPHMDHCSELSDLLTRFTSDGRSIHRVVDFGSLTLAKQHGRQFWRYVMNWVDEDATKQASLRELMSQIAELHEQGRIRYSRGGGGTIYRDPQRDCALRIYGPINLPAHSSANHLSLILVLEYGNASVLLPGDTERFGADNRPTLLDEALDEWAAYAVERQKDKAFDVIKIPHHGSRNAHLPRLFDGFVHADTVCVISVGTVYGLPAPEVIANLKGRGLSTFITNLSVRCRTQLRNFAIPDDSRYLDLLAPPALNPGTGQSVLNGDISITFGPAGGTNVGCEFTAHLE